MKKIILFNGNPKDNSFSAALCESYKKGAEHAGAKVQTVAIRELEFEHFLAGPGSLPSKDIAQVQELIKESEHLVFVFPIWWYTMPAMLKAYIEQTFSAGFAFKYLKSKRYVKHIGLLEGLSASVIATMDAPPLYYKLVIKNPAGKMLKETLKFCGVKNKKSLYFGSVKLSDETTRKKWLQKAEQAGRNLR